MHDFFWPHFFKKLSLFSPPLFWNRIFSFNFLLSNFQTSHFFIFAHFSLKVESTQKYARKFESEKKGVFLKTGVWRSKILRKKKWRIYAKKMQKSWVLEKCHLQKKAFFFSIKFFCVLLRTFKKNRKKAKNEISESPKWGKMAIYGVAEIWYLVYFVKKLKVRKSTQKSLKVKNLKISLIF